MEEFEIDEKLNELDKKLNQIKTQNKPVEENYGQVGELVVSAPNQQNLPITTQSEQATRDELLLKMASEDPIKMATTMVSQETLNIMKNDEEVKKKAKDLAKDTAGTAIDTLAKKNIKQKKQNYFDTNEKDIIPLGGDKTSSKGQQVSIVFIRRLYWIILMATIGFFYLAPMSVLLEIFQSISFKKVSKEEMISKQEILDGKSTPKERYVIVRYKLGMAGTILGSIMACAWAISVICVTILFPMIMLYISGVSFIIFCCINIFAPIDFRKILNREKAQDNTEKTERKTSAIVVEEEIEE